MSRASAIRVCILCAMALAAAGCVSPLDTDTPRLRFEDATLIPPTPARIKPRYFVITARDANTQTDWRITLADTLVEIDTTVHPHAVWIRATVGREVSLQTPQTPFVHDFRFRVDSLPANGKALTFAGEPAHPAGALVTLATERDTSGAPRLTTLVANAEKNIVTIKLETNGAQNLVSGVLAINLVAHRMQVEAKLTIRY